MGTFDRVIRILVAVAVLALFFAKVITGTLAVVLLVLSAVFVATSIVGFCPLYKPAGLSTAKKS